MVGRFAPALVVAIGTVAVPPAAAAINQRREAERVARAITAAPTVQASVTATVRALRRGGVTVRRGRRVVAIGDRPRSLTSLQLAQAVEMALGTRERAHAGELTLHDFALLLRAGRVRMPKGGPDRFVVRLVNGWVTGAMKQPKNPRAFTPLFLRAMIERQAPAIDIAKPFRPRDVRLTSLEWMLFATSLGRGRAPAKRPATSAVRASGPCTDLQKALNQEVPIVSADGTSVTRPGDLFQEALKQALKKGLGESGQKDVSRVLKLLSIVQKFHALALFYDSATIRVFPQDGDSVHRPIQNTKKVFHFSAIAGLDAEAQKEYENSWVKTSGIYQGVKDCAKAAGIPIPDSPVDVAKDLDKWRVLWTQLGSSADAVIDEAESHFDAGVHKHKLKRISDTEGAAVMAVDIQSENLNDHQRGEPSQVTFPMQADLLASQPPDPSKLKGMIESLLKADASAFGIAIAGIITDLLTNWAKAAVTPSAQGAVTITEHLPCTDATRRLIRLQVVRPLAGGTCQPLPTYAIDAVAIQQTSTATSTEAQNTVCDTTGTGNRSGSFGPQPATPGNELKSDGSGGYTGFVVASVDPVAWNATLKGCNATMPPKPYPPCTIMPSGTEQVTLAFRITVAPGDATAKIDWQIPAAFVRSGMPDPSCYFPDATATFDPAVDGHTTVLTTTLFATAPTAFTITENWTRTNAVQTFATQYTYTITMHAVYPTA